MKEYNVSLDEIAFLRIMNAEGLDIYWIPCFQNGIWTVGENASYVTVEHNEILHGADSNLLKWFLYRYEKSKTNFQEYVADNHDTNEFMNEVRNIWCAPLFPLLNGSMDDYLYAYNKDRDLKIDLPFGFSEKQVTFLKDGSVVYGKGNTIHVFEIYDYSEYVNFCKFIMKSMIHDF